jgi:hypothetical protein
MTPRRILPVAFLLACAWVPALAAPPEHQRLLEVDAPSGADQHRVIEAGFDVVRAKPGRGLWVLAWPADEARLAGMGARFRVIDDDPGATAAARSRQDLEQLRHERPSPAAPSDPRITVIPPFGQGSLGGFWTNLEAADFLDSLATDDPDDLVGAVETLGFSHADRPVLGLLLGKQDGGLSSRPAVLLNSLTHAREPQGMQSLLYFAHWLLSRYGSDPEATYLLDHRRIYLCPVVNPDGYFVNESLYVASGTGTFGFWRKNYRDNDGDGNFDRPGDGVDLNRNYGHQWGIPNGGSSSTPSSDVYRGPSAVSEPETEIQRQLVISLQPKTGLSFHTYGDYFIHPWGYTVDAPPDSMDFYDWSLEATIGSHYQLGQATRNLYAVNGEFNDYVYGNTTEKPRGYSWTPEVGNDGDGFWPSPLRILPLAEGTLRQCWATAYLAGAWVRVRSHELPDGPLWAGGSVRLRLLVRNKGVGEATGPDLVAALTPLSAGISVLQTGVPFPDLPPRTDGAPIGDSLFRLVADDTLTAGRRVQLRVDFTTPGGFFSRDTIELVVGVPTTVYANDAGSGLADFSPGGWGIANDDPNHPSEHFSDSPAGNYPSSADNTLLLNLPLDLSDGVHAYAEYSARWALEQDWDGVVAEASLDGVVWTAVAGRFTKPSAGISGSAQTLGQQVYDGNNYLWRPERLDLSDFTGPAATAVRLRFRLRSDGAKVFDGFRFDDLQVVVYDPAQQPGPVAVGDGGVPGGLALAAPWPNPARGGVKLQLWVPPGAGRISLTLHDVNGRLVRTLTSGELPPGPHEVRWDGRDADGRSVPSGLYFARAAGLPGAVTRRLAYLR